MIYLFQQYYVTSQMSERFSWWRGWIVRWGVSNLRIQWWGKGTWTVLGDGGRSTLQDPMNYEMGSKLRKTCPGLDTLF